MGQIFILFFFYFTVLFSILGYGKLVTLFNSNNQDNEFDGINGIASLIVLSYITNFFTAHNYLHNSIIILFGLLIFINAFIFPCKLSLQRKKFIFMMLFVLGSFFAHRHVAPFLFLGIVLAVERNKYYLNTSKN